MNSEKKETVDWTMMKQRKMEEARSALLAAVGVGRRCRRRPKRREKRGEREGMYQEAGREFE